MEKMEGEKKKIALVTGGTGFLGKNFTAYLLEKGWEVVCLVRPNSRYAHLKKDGIRLILGDFSQVDVLREAVHGVDAVFHLAAATAAVSIEKMFEVNCSATENLVKVCAEQEKTPVFVYVSSLAAAGPSTVQRPHEESDACRPVSWYGKSKLAAEFTLAQYADRVPISVVRPPIIFGPEDHEMRKWINAIRKTGFFFIPFLRPFRFSMVHSEDVSQLLLLAAEKGERMPYLSADELETFLRRLSSPKKLSEALPVLENGCGIYFASQTEHPTYVEMGRIFGKALGRKFTMILPVSPPVMGLMCFAMHIRAKLTGKTATLNLDKFREVNAGSWSCSAEKARRQLGFQNTDSLAEQCRKTAEWICRNG